MTNPSSFDTTTWIALALAALAGVETLLRGFSMILHAIAPRTKTTVDDRLAVRVDQAHDKLDALLALVPRPPNAVPVVVPRNTEAGFVARDLLLLLAPGVLLLAIVGLVWACGSTSKAAGKAALGDVVDCTTSDRVKLEAQFGPTVEQAILRATGGDGKIDLPSLNEIGHSLEADGWCVLERAVAQLVASVMTRNPSAPATAAAPLDARDLAAKLAALRAAKFGATRFQLAAQ